jgi:hypothetical protein
MRATSVFVRFLSLLDVSLVLLGVLMLALTQAQLRSNAGADGPRAESLPELAGIELICLYAGWEGPQKGRCFLLNAKGEVGREVRTDTSADIEEVLGMNTRSKERPSQVVLLFFAANGWYSDWPETRLSSIEKAWKIRVMPVYNVNPLIGAKP